MRTFRGAATCGTFVIVLSTMIGCEGDAQAPLSERRDSAGVAIVMSSAPEWREGEEWQLDSLPYLEASGAGPEYEFDRVADATMLEDGRLVVLDAGTHQVRFFGSEGQFLTRMGQEGEGPGDFQRLTNVSAFRGDSVLVFDYWLRRASILDETGSLQRVQTFAPEFQLQELHPLRDDTLAAVAWSLEEFADVEGPYRGRYLILRTIADGAVLDTVAVIDGWNGYKIDREDGGYRDAAPLFILDGHVATNDSIMVMGSAERMEFHRYSVTTPARFTVLEVGEDYVLGVRRDSLDVEHLQALRLHRSVAW